MLKFYDTKTRTVADFIPMDKNHIKMYVCGPTVYDFIHIGNARPLVVFDVLYRLLKHMYPKVTYVRNITDVDDKIYLRAKQNGQSIHSLTKQTEKQFLHDAKNLGSLSPTFQPRATEHIADMIAMIQGLLDKGHAYIREKHCIFSTTSWQEYGKFANKDRDQQIAGKRVDIASYKKHPADFVLWKPSKNDEPAWDSPWGKGRPGWHIECSAMSKKYLGEDFDIHGGGMDLIFPHHQNEIAQSCCAHENSTFAKYWLHNGFVMCEGDKMSKSLGNFYTVTQLTQEVSGLALRLTLLLTHYRKPLNFTKKALLHSEKLIQKIRTPLVKHGSIPADRGVSACAVIQRLCQDLNTPLALNTLWQYHKDFANTPSPKTKGVYLNALDILGLNMRDTPPTCVSIPKEVERLAEERSVAKSQKEWQRADVLREKIRSLQYDIVDTNNGYEIKKL